MRRDALTWYLEAVLEGSVEILGIRPLDGGGASAQPEGSRARQDGDPKAFGYGRPIQVDVLLDGAPRSYVLSSMRPGPGFGHDHFADRAGSLIWAHDAYGKLPRHVRSLDVGFVTREGELGSAGRAQEYFLLTEKVEGTPYAVDLQQIRADGTLSPLDLDRARTLAAYLAEIHAQKGQDAQLYYRRTRELLGHGEEIMGILDGGYPADYPLLPAGEQRLIEVGCVGWRHRLKEKAKRLSLVHGDFHPWNILFRAGRDFTLLDRSRGEWGEPADDVASLSVNYLFFSLLLHGEVQGPFARLFKLFYSEYLDHTRDRELAEVIPPFFLFRALVIASPLWYPDLSDEVRRKLLRFARAMLNTEQFDYRAVGRYFV